MLTARGGLPGFFWWELLFLMQRLFIVGFVQLIPPEHEFGRMLCGLFTALLYLVLLLAVRPFQRHDNNISAIASQVDDLDAKQHTGCLNSRGRFHRPPRLRTSGWAVRPSMRRLSRAAAAGAGRRELEP